MAFRSVSYQYQTIGFIVTKSTAANTRPSFTPHRLCSADTKNIHNMQDTQGHLIRGNHINNLSTLPHIILFDYFIGTWEPNFMFYICRFRFTASNLLENNKTATMLGWAKLCRRLLVCTTNCRLKCIFPVAHIWRGNGFHLFFIYCLCDGMFSTSIDEVMLMLISWLCGGFFFCWLSV